MMRKLQQLVHALENALLYLLVALLLGLSIYQIVLRNFFDSGLYWADPLLRVLVLWLAMMGAMIASRDRAHIKIDLLSHYVSERASAVIDALAALASAVICFIAAWYSYLFVADEREFGEIAFAQVPAWLCESIIPVGLAIIGLRFLFEIGQTLFAKTAQP